MLNVFVAASFSVWLRPIPLKTQYFHSSNVLFVPCEGSAISSHFDFSALKIYVLNTRKDIEKRTGHTFSARFWFFEKTNHIILFPLWIDPSFQKQLSKSNFIWWQRTLSTSLHSRLTRSFEMTVYPMRHFTPLSPWYDDDDSVKTKSMQCKYQYGTFNRPK